MKKQTKVLLAAALFTLGASFSSMAALKNGTWQLNEEGWQYANKEGDYVDSTWCVSYGKEYWINEDYVLGASEWVEDDTVTGRWYYAQSDGSKTINAWKYLYAPTDEDEEGEENWYYFDAKGRMVADKKYQVGDYYYYFDNTGKMLTGWVEYAKDVNDVYHASKADASTVVGNVFYTNEDGQLVKSSWINMYPWTMTEDEAYDEDYKYYYAGSTGALAKTKTKIGDLHYFFDATTGQQIDGWVKRVGTTSTYTAANAIDLASGSEFYWTDEDSYAKKNQWLYLATPQSGDSDSFWYWFDKNGKLFVPTATDSNVYAVDFVDGESNDVDVDTTAIFAKSKKFGDDYYFFNNKGEMLNGLLEINGDINYLVDGVRQTGKVELEDDDLDNYTFYFASKTDNDAGTTKYAAVTGNYDGYLYIDGQLIKAVDTYKVVTINGVGSFIIDTNGAIQHSATKEYTLEEAYNGSTTFKASAANKAFAKNNVVGTSKYSIINAQ